MFIAMQRMKIILVIGEYVWISVKFCEGFLYLFNLSFETCKTDHQYIGVAHHLSHKMLKENYNTRPIVIYS
jgi:hypothetical protein